MLVKKSFIALCILVLSLALSGARCGEKPGEGALAKKGFANAQPIIEALNQYYKEKNDYPQFLDDLAPKYLSEVPRDENNNRFSYYPQTDKKSYELQFIYDAPVLGICKCTYYSNSKRWSCIDMI